MARKKNDTSPSRRGRPPAYDAETALKRATEAFWRTGYSGTSLDKVAAVTGMSPPSLYAVFGNKHALYLEALAHYWETSLAATREALAGDHPLDEALMLAYEAALSIYFSGRGTTRGCFVVGTAVTEVAEDAEIRNSVSAGLRAIDADFEARFRRARDEGELKPDVDPAALAILAAATMQTIAIRARAGTRRAELRELARKAVDAICGCRPEARQDATPA
ncbi:TetR/AcrR family transcriptional regulator [Bradyrhizobium sp. WYCCWR 13023]|uniref:TetR/AcrR family transcriptional regulator n=1 Tax=Bradyrhizobium zhengyangense TaxID=2911009 RepID=A0A9X1R699_9BRAD|nr:TetR/AcrR family transcriptional regulator [Bradyrhizobium zhengyangense]MCG2625737.1 TetR/AcrR family transcriptional regulator [Bradyrhizobium zhengyangense]MCG2638351.1 TetR/AcrR family transcriptional regulator [Bradyrhizobium zhengyangense]MCG2666750.1 TetR/AcrR family transcriptional regulator [Bradyrhizobium zhengyangense]